MESYFSILKRSTRLIIKGYPNKDSWLCMWGDIKDAWDGLYGVLIHLIGVLLWVLVTITSPISLPLISMIAFIVQRYRGRQ